MPNTSSGYNPHLDRIRISGGPETFVSPAAGGTDHGYFAGVLLACDRWLGRLVQGTAAALLAIAATVSLYQVITRFVLERPATWSEVLVRTLIVWMVFLGIPGAMRTGALVCFDFAQRLTHGWVLRAVQTFILLCSLMLFTVLIWHGYKMAWRVRFQVLAGLDVSIAWAYAAIPVGSAFAILAVLARWFDPAPQREPTPDILV